MRDLKMTAELLKHIEDALSLIIAQTEKYQSANDFLHNPQDVLILDGICMNLLVTGEAIKNLDKQTGGTFLVKYPDIPWKDIMRMRDIIAHHYFDIDAEKILTILHQDIPPLLKTIQKMRQDIIS